MFGRAIMHDARSSLITFAVLSAVLRSGFRDTDSDFTDMLWRLTNRRIIIIIIIIIIISDVCLQQTEI